MKLTRFKLSVLLVILTTVACSTSYQLGGLAAIKKQARTEMYKDCMYEQLAMGMHSKYISQYCRKKATKEIPF